MLLIGKPSINHLFRLGSWFPWQTVSHQRIIKHGNGRSSVNGGIVRWENHRTEWSIFQQATVDDQRVYIYINT